MTADLRKITGTRIVGTGAAKGSTYLRTNQSLEVSYTCL